MYILLYIIHIYTFFLSLLASSVNSSPFTRLQLRILKERLEARQHLLLQQLGTQGLRHDMTGGRHGLASLGLTVAAERQEGGLTAEAQDNFNRDRI